MACRTGCPTQDHASWGECASAANIGVASATMQAWAHGPVTQKRWQSDIDYYKSARRQGLSPARSDRATVQRAFEAAEKAA